MKVKNYSQGGFLLTIIATLILIVDALVNNERIYISQVFAFIGIVKIMERIYNFNGNKSKLH